MRYGSVGALSVVTTAYLSLAVLVSLRIIEMSYGAILEVAGLEGIVSRSVIP
jgi:hypothetical protein